MSASTGHTAAVVISLLGSTVWQLVATPLDLTLVNVPVGTSWTLQDLSVVTWMNAPMTRMRVNAMDSQTAQLCAPTPQLGPTPVLVHHPMPIPWPLIRELALMLTNAQSIQMPVCAKCCYRLPALLTAPTL